MRIVRLILENFAPILAGTGKERIELDLSASNNLVNVLIGKIGSGKTYILSHLQPFSTVGTLDPRNVDDPIIEGKDGYKEIVYQNGSDLYKIYHTYTWTKKSHAKKSYIEKNGEELNPNGNASTFQECVLAEFGIDPSFLRLIRIGPNVTNFIQMKTAERKQYIAALLKETEIYLLLHKKWSAELKELTAKVNVLLNKLHTIGDLSLDEMKEQLGEIEDQRRIAKEKADDINQNLIKAKSEISFLLDGLSYDGFTLKVKEVEESIETTKSEIETLQDTLKRFESYPELNELSKEIGKLDGKLGKDEENLHELEVEYKEKEDALNILLDKKKMLGDDDHLETLKTTHQQLTARAEEYESKLKGFRCNYSSTFLSGLLEEINLISVTVNELTQYNNDVIRQIYNSDSSIITFSKNKIEMLQARKLKVQRLMNNLKFSAEYEPPERLFVPPMCPTPTCPYYTSHPETIKRSTEDNNHLNEDLIRYQNELQEIDVDIYKYNDFPLIYSKIATLKEYWRKIEPILKELRALKLTTLMEVITKSGYIAWYDYDQIVEVINKIQMKDKYSELMEELKTIKSEMDKIDLNRDDTLDVKISALQAAMNDILVKINSIERDRSEDKQKLEDMNKLYLELSKKSELEKDLSDKNTSLSNLITDLRQKKINEEKIQQDMAEMTRLNQDFILANQKLDEIIKQQDLLRSKINDYAYTKDELEGVKTEQKYMTYMVDAVGSKKGIPMLLVKLFFENCRATVNDMLYLVTEDFSLDEFLIGETDFLIPYTVNGNQADDISKASQGQTSITSTALSFAIVKELGSVAYNIPLLDEPDAPLHKNDKEKLIAILYKYLEDIGAEQCFVITHDENTFNGHEVQIIMTTDELVDDDRYPDAIHI